MKVHYSAGGIVVTQGKNKKYLLLLQRLLNRGLQWVCPKGYIENGETAQEAARREVYEEAGVKNLKILGFLGVNIFHFSKREKYTKGMLTGIFSRLRSRR